MLVGDVFVNVDRNTVSGIDFEANYRSARSTCSAARTASPPACSRAGSTRIRRAGRRRDDRPGRPDRDPAVGRIAYSLPEWKATGNLTYQNGGFSAFLQGRYIGDGTLQNTLVEGVNIESNHVDSAFYADLALSYRWELGEGAELEVFGQVTNLLDEDPPITPYYSAFLGYSQQYNPSLFDVLGRRYTLGFRLTR